jgi:hypothetical protein
MACGMKIGSVTVYGSPGQTVNSIVVSGIATGCPGGGYVIINCGGPNLTQTFQGPGSSGTYHWQVTFTNLAGSNCICDSANPTNPHHVLVEAFCSADQTCNDKTQVRPIICSSCCPTVTLTAEIGDCDSQGQRAVNFKVHITPASDPNCPQVFAQLDFGDGNFGQAFTAPPSYNWQGAHTYSPGTYTVKVHLIAPSGCFDAEIRVIVPPCGTGGGNGGHPCPWWQPRCWLNFCGGLLAAAMAIVLAAGVLIIAACCNQNWVVGAAAVATALGALFLLWLWYHLCSKISPGFCDTVKQLIAVVEAIIFIQTIALVILGALYAGGTTEVLPCLIGVAVSWGYYGTVLALLDKIRQWSHCHD